MALSHDKEWAKQADRATFRRKLYNSWGDIKQKANGAFAAFKWDGRKWEQVGEEWFPNKMNRFEYFANNHKEW